MNNGAISNLGPRLKYSESVQAANSLLKEVLGKYSPSEIVVELARTEWDDPTQILEIFENSGLLPSTNRKVNSAAAYFHTLGLGGGERVTKSIATT